MTIEGYGDLIQCAVAYDDLFEARTEVIRRSIIRTRSQKREDMSVAEQRENAEMLFTDKQKSLHAFLVGATTGEARGEVRRYATEQDGMKAYRGLRDKYENTNLGKRSLLMKEFNKLTIPSDTSPAAPLQRLIEIRDELKPHKVKKTDDELITHALCMLPKEYDAVSENWQTALEKEELDLEGLISKIQNYYDHTVCRRKDERIAEEKDRAFFQRELDKLRADIKNRADTPDKKGRNGDRHNKKQSRRRPPADMSNEVCGKCKNKGHWWRQCPNQESDKKREETKDGINFTVDLAPATVLMARARVKDGSIIDSGATKHAVGSARGMTNITHQKTIVGLGDDSELTAIGRGTLRYWAYAENGEKVYITLDEVLVVPGLQYNLISSGRLKLLGQDIHTGKKDYWEIDGKLIPLVFVGGLFVATLHLIDDTDIPDPERALIMDDEAKERQWNKYHGRMAHRNDADVLAMGSLLGMPADLLPQGKCHICAVSKHTRKSFPKQRTTKSQIPFEVVHTDFSGQITDSLGGSRHMLGYVDECSGWVRYHFLSDKSLAPRKFKDFVDETARMTKGKYRVQHVHSDNEPVLVSKEIKAICAEKGIKMTTSGNYSPQQNGRAERSWRTIDEGATTLLTAAGLDRTLWAEAARTTEHVLNRLRRASNDGMSPYAKVFGNDKPLDYLKTFGCVAYVHRNDRKKFQEKAWVGIFVGYDEDNPTAYRIYDPLADAVRPNITQVTFDEDLMYTQLQKRLEETLGSDVDVNNWLARWIKDSAPVGEVTSSTPAPAGDAAGENTDVADAAGAKSTHDNSSNPVGELDPPDAVPPDPPPIQNTDRARRNKKAPTLYGDWDFDDDEVNLAIEHAFLAIDVNETNEDYYLEVVVDHAMLAATNVIYESAVEPRSYAEAMRTPERNEWRKACEEEYASLIQQGTWTLVDRPTDKRVLKATWSFKNKRDSTGHIARRKGRWCVKGFAQKAGLDYTETFAPVAMAKTFMTVLSIAAIMGWFIENWDVVTAYLNAKIDKEIYVEQPEGFAIDGRVCRLNKSLYGLKQAARNWNLTIHKWLLSRGYVRSNADACLYIKTVGAFIIVIILYVDDLVVAGNSQAMIDRLKADISKRFPIKDLSKDNKLWILGMEVKRDWKAGTLELNQDVYRQQVLKRFGMEDCVPVATPMIDKPLKKCTEKKEFDHDYSSLVGSLNWLSMISMPELTYSTNQLARHMQSPDESHWEAGKRALRYLKGVENRSIKFGGPDIKEVKLTAYSDADWANDLEDRVSVTGYVNMLGGACTSWRSMKQKCVATSSQHSEYMALSETAREVVFMRGLLAELGFEQKEPTIIYEDNTAAKALAENPVNHNRSKHIDVQYHYVRTAIEDRLVKVEWIPTKDQLADLFTKPLDRIKLEEFRKKVTGHNE